MSVDETPTPVRRRPRNRRQLILDAAGLMFSERGYHGASMDELAAKLDISATALYRHFPNKAALFAECTTLMVDRLLAVLAELPEDVTLSDQLAALVQVTYEHRATGGVYRWESRFLDVQERRALRAKFAAVVEAVATSIQRELGGEQASLRASAALGAVGSITLHRTPIPRLRATQVLVDAALGAASVDPATATRTASVVHLPAAPASDDRRAQILSAAIPLFARHGFRAVTMGQIAAVVGLVPSGLYRHYPTKTEILAAACLQTSALVDQVVQQALREVSGPADELQALTAAYVAYRFENRELISVAEAEIVGLPPDLRRPVVLAQRQHVATWETCLAAVRPDLEPRAARTLVHAGLGTVVEAGRSLRWQDTGENRDLVTALLLGALGVAR